MSVADPGPPFGKWENMYYLIFCSHPDILLLNCPQNGGNSVSEHWKSNIFRVGHAPGPPWRCQPPL